MSYNVLVDKYRPKEFKDIIGQDILVSTLKKIIKTPNNYPKNLLFYGERGVGKTSLARAFASEFRKTGTNIKLKEYDVTNLNKDSMKDISETIKGMFNYSNDVTILIFDEFHLFSREAQSVLLPLLEDNLDNNLYYIFCTTELNKIIDTIISRCTIKFNFKNISNETSVKFIDEIIEKESIDINDEMKEMVIDYSKGHLRDILQYLDLYKLAGKEHFIELINSSFALLNNYLFGDETNSALFQSYPVDVLVRDINLTMEKYVLNNISKDFSNVIKIFEMYMKLKNNIKTIEDFTSIIIILKKMFTQSRGNNG